MITLDTLKERPLSYSSIKEFAKSPAHYINYLNKPKKQTPELTFGSALHCLILQPEEFNNQFIKTRKLDLRKTADKEENERITKEAEATGKIVIQEDMFEEVNNLKERCLRDNELVSILSNSKKEVRENIELYGLPFVRIKDIETDTRVVDIKTVQNASLDAIIKDFFNYQYYIQAAIYEGSFSFYVVEKNEPFYTGLLPISDEFLIYGRKQLQKLCVAFNYCLENVECFNMSYDFWYQFEDRKPIISLPNWVK
jgi:PDDEXK-like domain of unknown function (DUF3799)